MEERGNVAGFRISSKSWFLTWPKCSLTKEEVLAGLRAKKPIKAAVIARELHEDGTPHIHAYVLLEKRFDCRQSSFWDLAPFHGNYQKAKSIDAVIRYIKKDGDILEFGEISWAEKIDSRQEHRRYLGKRLMEEPLEDIVRDDPSLMFGLTRLRTVFYLKSGRSLVAAILALCSLTVLFSLAIPTRSCISIIFLRFSLNFTALSALLSRPSLS